MCLSTAELGQFHLQPRSNGGMEESHDLLIQDATSLSPVASSDAGDCGWAGSAVAVSAPRRWARVRPEHLFVRPFLGHVLTVLTCSACLSASARQTWEVQNSSGSGMGSRGRHHQEEPCQCLTHPMWLRSLTSSHLCLPEAHGQSHGSRDWTHRCPGPA